MNLDSYLLTQEDLDRPSSMLKVSAAIRTMRNLLLGRKILDLKKKAQTSWNFDSAK